jgi:asparagine synthase (glutamine-hydrolysing)
MVQALRHRGPDAQALRIAGRVGLAHARLAIIDLSPAGAQPMATPDGRFVIAFNGEIYNFPALRTEMETRGERFTGRSDTEIVLRLLARDGADALARLDGMFALALVDTTTSELWLARDRTGQKPLYVARLGGGGLARSIATRSRSISPSDSCPRRSPCVGAYDNCVPGR